MKMLGLCVGFLLSLIALPSLAAWQVANSEYRPAPKETFFQAPKKVNDEPAGVYKGDPIKLSYRKATPTVTFSKENKMQTPYGVAPIPLSYKEPTYKKRKMRTVSSYTGVYREPELPPLYAVSISGSLKENLERIMTRYHWKVIWKAPYDYNFDGRVIGGSLPNVVEKLLQPFPLQAVMYMSNRTLAIVPRAKT